MILHWTEGPELFALYREVANRSRYVVCQFEPHPNFHDPVTGEVLEYASNSELDAVQEGAALPEDVTAGLVQYFSFPTDPGTGKPTSRS